jgi:glycosyltransferase involved in cell wall biosynthesis
MPLVSIITATRNRPGVLAPALDSIARQTLTDYELLVVDDGSPEDVHEEYCRLLKPFGGRARVLRKDPLRDKSGTPAIARNRGINEAQGKWVAFLDDDDRWIDPRHLDVAVACLEATQSDLYFANMRGERNGVVEVTDYYPDSPFLTSGATVNNDPHVFDVSLESMVGALRHHSIHPDVVVISRELLLSVGAFCERIVFSEDYELIMRVVDSARAVLYRPDPVATYALPVLGSHSLRVQPIDQLLDRQTAAQNLRIKCKRSEVRRCARQRESWVLRELADVLEEQSLAEALRLRCQAWVAHPSAGSFWSLLRSKLAARFNGTCRTVFTDSRAVVAGNSTF